MRSSGGTSLQIERLAIGGGVDGKAGTDGRLSIVVSTLKETNNGSEE
jgi:hypothetical protein